jgi:hypothetical protein
MALKRRRKHPVGLIDLKTLKAVAEGFNEKAGGGRIRWYSQEAWAERGEPYGQGSYLTALIEDNGLGMLLNYAETDYAYALQDQFYRAVNTLGWHAELGTAWSLHFYRNENAE